MRKIDEKGYGYNGKIAVVALGGNALNRKGESGDIHAQFANSRMTARLILKLVMEGYKLVITHGNGPQVGDRMIQVEAAIDKVPDIPLGVLVADTQGGMGYMIEQCIHNVMRREFNMSRPYIATVLTQVIVDKNDPSILSPSKPIGPYYSKEQAEKMTNEHNWQMVEDLGRGGWRRVVPSPIPKKIVETGTIKALLDANFIVIACGGGGIPVYKEEDGWLEGVDAVVDKDRASAVLADFIGADELIILTDVDAVAVNFRKENQRFLSKVGLRELKKHYDEGQFPKGSMGPKIEGVIQFLSNKDCVARKALITSPEKTEDALAGGAGTWIMQE